MGKTDFIDSKSEQQDELENLLNTDLIIKPTVSKDTEMKRVDLLNYFKYYLVKKDK